MPQTTFVKAVTLDTARKTLKNKHGIKASLAELREFLGDPSATHIGKDVIVQFAGARKGDAEADAAPKDADEPQAVTPPAADPAPAPELAPDYPTKPLREVVRLLTERNINVTVRQAAEFLGVAEEAEVTIDQFKRLGEEFRTKVSEGAELEVLAKRPGRFGKVARKVRDSRGRASKQDYEIASAFFEKVKAVWAALDEKPKVVRVETVGYTGYCDVLNPERIIEMPYKLFRALNEDGELPPLHDDSVSELAVELACISLFRTHGAYCGLPMDTYYEGMVRAILDRNTVPPLVRLNRAEKEQFGLTKARPFIFHQEHSACGKRGGLVDMMSNLEFEFEGPETVAKDIKRANRYIEELRKPIDDSGRTLLQDIIESEWIFDPSTRRRRHLTARELFDRVRAINDNLNKKEGVA